MSLQKDKIQSLGLTLAVLREAFNASDSAERLANMDVPAITRNLVRDFDVVIDAIKGLEQQSKRRWISLVDMRDDRDRLRAELYRAKERIASLRHVGLELTGAIEEYSAMPCDSLLKRMIGSAERYRPRLSTVLEPCAPAVCETCNGTRVVDDDPVCSSGGVPFENGPVECVKDCPACAPVEDGKYDLVLKPFMRLMERELHANSHKGDRPAWLKMTAGECLLEIYFHAGKLHKAVHGSQGDDILEYAADVANLSMMLTDIVGALGLFARDEAANAKG